MTDVGGLAFTKPTARIGQATSSLTDMGACVSLSKTVKSSGN
jgi:hypothetical protein